MFVDVLGAKLDDMRVPIGRLCLDLGQNLQRRVVLSSRLDRIGLTFGGVALLNQKVRFEELIARIVSRPDAGRTTEL